MAARLPTMSVADIAARLGAESLLHIGSRGGTERQRSLRRTIQWSYDLLSEAGRVLLRRLWLCRPKMAVGARVRADNEKEHTSQNVDRPRLACWPLLR